MVSCEILNDARTPDDDATVQRQGVGDYYDLADLSPHPVFEKIDAATTRYANWAEDHPVKATVVETVVLYGVRKAVEHGGRRLGWRLDNAVMESHLDAAAEHPVRGFIKGVMQAPVVEEIVSRGMLDEPARAFERRGDKRSARLVRLGSAALFAAAHSNAIGPHDHWPKPPFVRVKADETTSVPIGHFAAALQYQRLHEQRGFQHNVLAHVTNNLIEAATKLPEVVRRRKALQQRT